MSDAGFSFDPKQILDVDTALARVRGKKSIYKRMLGLFSASEEFSRFESMMQNGDYNGASEAAHAIKGMTGNLGMNDLFETSEKLMVQLRGGSYDEEVLARYRAALEETRKAVEELIPQLVD